MADFPFQLPPKGGSSAGSTQARTQRFMRNLNLRAQQQSVFSQALADMIQSGQSAGPSQSALDARRAAALNRLTGAGRGVQGPSPFRWAQGSRPAGYLPTSTTGSAMVPTTGSQLARSGTSGFRGAASGGLKGLASRGAGPLLNTGLVALDVYDATQTGRDPLRAGVRGATTVLGGLGAGALGGAAGLPTTGPGAIPAAIASYTAGSLGTGALFDQIWPENTPMNDTTRYARQPGFIGPVPQPAPGFIGPMPEPQQTTGAWTIDGYDPNAPRSQRERSSLPRRAPVNREPQISESELRARSVRSDYDKIRAAENLTDPQKSAIGLEMWRRENPKLAERLDEKTFGDRVPGKAGYNPLMQDTFGYQSEPAVRQPLEGEEIINAVNANKEAELRERFTAPEGADQPKFVIEEVLQPAAKDEKSARAKLLQRALTRRILDDQDFPANAPKISF
jgi:hypothetical protein